MAQIQTPFRGITTTSTYQEGDMYSLVNLRPKNGALETVPPRKVVQELSKKYDIVFVHQNNDYENWIGVVNSGNYSSIYSAIDTDSPVTIQSYMSGPVHSVEQVGNTISLVTEDNIYYLLFLNNRYTFLGELPELPVINLNTSTQMSRAQLHYVNEYGSGAITTDNFIDATKGLVNKAMEALVDGYTDPDGTTHEGQGLQLFDACFIRYAFRLYDGSLTKHSPPILVMPVRNILNIKNVNYFFMNGVLDANFSYVEVFGYRIYISYDLTSEELTKWSDIITSVEIFMSQPLGLSNIENIRTDLTLGGSLSTSTNLIKSISPEALKSVKETSNFYFMKTLELGTSAGAFERDPFPTSDSEISTLENLIYQEEMTDDNFSHHIYGAQASHAYNNRLHLGGIKTTFFKGFNINYFRWGSVYNGTLVPTENVKSIVVEVELHTGIGVEKVYSAYSEYFTIPKLFSSAMISYPDTRAKKMTIYEVTDSVWRRVQSFLLTPHNFLNLAYYLNDGFKPVIGTSDLKAVTAPNISQKVFLFEPNKIKVSELNNPLKLPNINTYQVGNGKIMAMATNATSISEGQFGQFPLYVFTSLGIYSLEVGSGEVLYSNLSAPTSYDVPTTPAICSMPYGVVFTTQRGLSIINGQQIQYISPQLEQIPSLLNMEDSEPCESVLFKPEKKRFGDIIKSVSDLIYNPIENELIVNIKDAEANFVLNFSDQSFYQSTEKIDGVVKNIFPKLYVWAGKELKDYSQIEKPETHISFITRPMSFGIEDIKKLERMILRGTIYNVSETDEGKKAVILTYHSNDKVNFPITRGLYVHSGNKKDFDMGMFLQTKNRYYLFAFAGIVGGESRFHYLDTIFDKEYNNTKMR